MGALEEFANYMAASGYGTAGTDLFYGVLPDSPTTCVAFIAGWGLPSDKVLNEVEYDRPNIMVVARSSTEAQARSKAQDIYSAIDGKSALMSGIRWAWMEAVSLPYLQGRDDSGNYHIGFAVTGYRKR